MSKFKQFIIKTFSNRGFDLTPVEFKDVVPFVPKRLYFFQNLKADEQTGEHCHKIEQEVFILVKGAITAIIDKGAGKENIRLEKIGEALYVSDFVWHGFKEATADCAMLAISSTNYSADRSDYIENYDEYLKVRGQKSAV